MQLFPAILILIIVSCIPAASAGEVVLSTPQNVYYIVAGEEAVIPVTLASTYGHDITGTLQQSMTRLDTGTSGSRDQIVQSREFSAFTDTRTVSLSAGRSEVPADYLLTFVFRYNEGGTRTSTLGGIVVHFVTSADNTPSAGAPLTSADTADTVAATSSGNAAPADNPLAKSPAAALQNSQMSQDTSALRNQMAEESNRSEQAKDELLGFIRSDPLVVSRDRSLTGAGFVLNKTRVVPASNRSGSFLLTYSSGPENAVIKGDLLETRVLFAEESADAPVPLPEVLTDNTTYQAYGLRIAGNGFSPGQTWINVTTGKETVDLTYTSSRYRTLHMHAEILNGSVVTVAGEAPEDPLAPFIPLIALVSVVLISAGIWYLARSHKADLPAARETVREPAFPRTPREIASDLLDEAERDAAGNRWPDAYRKTGRAIRIVLSHQISHGEEMTSGELEHLIGGSAGETEKIRGLLERCRMVGFAREIPGPEEFPEIVSYSRALVNEGIQRDEAQAEPEY
jgi:hypothetical protein